jgi:hypothetical protein
VGELAPHRAEVGEQILGVPADDVAGEALERRRLHLVAAADGEGEAVAGVPVGGVRGEPDVGRRVVRVGVHGVRPVQRDRRGEADVVRLQPSDLAHVGCTNI